MNQKRKKHQELRVGIAQINPTVGDFSGNAEKICFYIEQAERQHCDVIAFPELALCGYPVWDLAIKTSFVRRGLQTLHQIARSTRHKKITVIVGFIDRARSAGRKNHNALAVIRNGHVVHRQAKSLLPTYDVFLEDIFFMPARTQRTFKLGSLTVGANICEDIWDDSYETKPTKMLKRQGASVLFNISASPFSEKGVAKRIEQVRRKAKEYGLWIVYVNQVGGQDDLIFDGHSLVVSPSGQVVFQADRFQEQLYCTSFVVGERRANQMSAVKRVAEKDIYDALVLGLSDYLRKNRFRKVVIGLSGGIDSALVATLACDALGPQAVIGISLPGPYSSKESATDAHCLARALGIEFRVDTITSLYRRFVSEAKQMNKVRRPLKTGHSREVITVGMENVQARLRGMKLMFVSNEESALLLTTGNKSELAMGYSTLYGDMCGGLSVIGDVYKTEVYRLARFRNSISRVIPESILRKPPSAELRPNQKDQDTLPPYPVLDTILRHYIELNQSLDEVTRQLATKRIPAKLIRHVLSVVDHNEYKRRQLPPALRITEKAWFGRRMPITNRFDR